MTPPSKPRMAMLVVLACLALVTFTGCGGSDSLVHIDGTSASISPQTLRHWMQALAASDFRTEAAKAAPAGLVSEPADYSRCAEAVRSIAPKTGTGQTKLSEAKISTHCHDLYRAIKEQAMSYLISSEWTFAEGAEMGLKVSRGELERAFERLRALLYPTNAQLKSYMAERHFSLVDILFQVARSILVSRILPKFEATVAKAGGQQSYARIALERYHRLIARTSCRAGYVALGCKEYRGTGSSLSASAAQVILAIVKS